MLSMKKTMKLWQMITVLTLTLGMIVTMFLPAFRVNGDVLEEITKLVLEETGLGALGISEEFVDEQLAEKKEKIDKNIADYEEKNHVTISRISPLTIMTTGFVKLMYGDDLSEDQLKKFEEDESFIKVRSSYNTLRCLLWIVYVLAFVIILITILGFCLHWSKFISLIISGVYSFLSVILFAYLRFGLMGTIAEKAGDMLDGVMDKLEGSLSLADSSLSIAKLLSCFYSVAFLIAFIISIVLLVASILFMFIGKQQKVMENIGIDSVAPGWGNDISLNGSGANGAFNNEISGNGVFDSIETEIKTEIKPIPSAPIHPVYTPPIPTPPVQKPVVQAPMGQVKCTKGIVAGQGFMLPQDRKVIVGKSPQNANLVINNQHISNVHCSIRYNAISNTYIVKDHSSNGTFVNGVRLQKDVSMTYPAGTVLSLADGQNEITLG